MSVERSKLYHPGLVKQAKTVEWTQSRRLKQLLDVNRELMTIVSVKRLLHRIAGAATQLTGSQSADVWLLDGETGDLRFIVATSICDQVVTVPVLIEGASSNLALFSRQILTTRDARVAPSPHSAIKEQTD